MIRKILLTLICFSVLSFQSLAEVSLGKKVTGMPSVKTTEGKDFDWSAYNGKVLVLEWLNPDCPFVKRHYKEKTFHKLVDGFDKAKIAWIGINSTHYMSVDATSSWKEEQGISWPILMDNDGKLGRFFGAKTTPHIFVVSPEGNLVYEGAIDDDPYGSKNTEERKSHLAFLSKGTDKLQVASD